MKLEGYFPAKNLILLESIKTSTSSSGSIILAEEKFVGYYKVLKVGPLAVSTKPGNFVISTLQMGVEMEFDEGAYMQIPEQGIDGYYSPSSVELENPTPVLKRGSIVEEEEMNIIDSEGGDNSLGSELNMRGIN